MSPHISPYLPVSPHVSPYLEHHAPPIFPPISPPASPQESCTYLYGHVTSLELAARKLPNIGQVLQEVFTEVQVSEAYLYP